MEGKTFESRTIAAYASPPQEDEPMGNAVGDRPAAPTGLALYKRGEPLWHRELLEDIRAQMKEHVKLFVIHYIDCSLVPQTNLAYEHPDTWHTKLVFFGYRHLIDQSIQNSPSGLQYASYAIRQRSVYDLEYPYLFPQYGIDELDREFRIASKAWVKHDARHKLAAALFGLELPPNINKVICFGLGNHLTKEFEYWTQHPAAITIKNVLKIKFGWKVRLLTHFPEYTSDTKAVLEKHGFEVIGRNGIDGFLEVDENSLVFCKPSDIPVRQILADLARPAVIITRPFREADLNWVDKTEKDDRPRLGLLNW
ncbi:hypothetical protein FHL15_005745 [Xylaria flabelliformis]|uniref:SRR1-like domain-containing protein n=1 Tax=Xylaria flabelliformis TaxID=2512241 RepID=A0A553HZU2_9PEZI|nr:hypothetical protein FHL15_005745 [Xylaria flabelliformis]